MPKIRSRHGNSFPLTIVAGVIPRPEFRKITRAAGLGTDWVPREMRHTFVSLLSANGMALEDIADLVGHRGTATTETVYRKVIVPELRRGAEVMDQLFS
jgi:integrase